MLKESVSSPSLLESIRFDDLSWILLALVLISFFFHRLLVPDQSWTMHPILLGHQANFSRIRKQSETPIITNSGSTHGLFPVTPDRSIKSLHDLLLKSEGKFPKIDTQSTFLSSVSFNTLVSNARHHLWSLLASNIANQDQAHPQLMILCSDPHVKLVFSLAAATLPITTIIASTYQSGTVPVEVKQALAPHVNRLSLIVSEIPKDEIKDSLGSNLVAQILSMKDLSSWFQSNVQSEIFHPIGESELAKARLWVVNNLSKSDDQPRVGARVFEFTPQNLLAGITSSLGLFPSPGKLASTDTIALESHGDVSIWGSEISFAAAALSVGANVYFFNGFKHLSGCKPTVLVIKAMTAQILAGEVIQLSKLSFIKKIAVGYRLSKVSNGTLASPLPETTKWVGPKLRAILTNDAVSQSSANLIRAGFGVTFQRVYTHPTSAGPILASQPNDFQILQRPAAALHCGPPSVNMECKIVEVPEPSITNNDAWKGKLLVRGPSVGVELQLDTPSKGDPSPLPDSQFVASDGFYEVARIAHVLPNGTFQVLSSSAFGDD